MHTHTHTTHTHSHTHSHTHTHSHSHTHSHTHTLTHTHTHTAHTQTHTHLQWYTVPTTAQWVFETPLWCSWDQFHSGWQQFGSECHRPFPVLSSSSAAGGQSARTCSSRTALHIVYIHCMTHLNHNSIDWKWVLCCVSTPQCEGVPSLASVAPVRSAVKEYSLWPPLPLFIQVWRSTLSGLHCPSLFSCEGEPSLTSIAPVHSAVKEYPLWPMLPQFIQLWRGLYFPCSFSCEAVHSLPYVAPVDSAVKDCPPLPQFTQLWNEHPFLFQFTQLWMCTLLSFTPSCTMENHLRLTN